METPYILEGLDTYRESQLNHTTLGAVTLGKVPVRNNVLLIGASLREHALTTLDVSVEVAGKAIHIARDESLQVANITVDDPRGVMMLHEPIDSLWLTKDTTTDKWRAHVDPSNVASDKALKEFVGIVARFAFGKLPEL